MNSEDATKWIVVAFMVLVGLVTLVIARQMIAPIDRFVTEQACAVHGDDLGGRPVVDVERSNRFGLINRSYGWCMLGPVELEGNETADGTAFTASDSPVVDPTAEPLAGAEADPTLNVQVDLQDVDPGALYRTLKIMGIVLQLGAASLAVRVLGEPILDRFVRSRR
ncbi:MAG: hypothetical protein GY773_05730 [Actinomycetia bacterium]|nr:hypothetical protein [Actinomycetes bacterium]